MLTSRQKVDIFSIEVNIKILPKMLADVITIVFHYHPHKLLSRRRSLNNDGALFSLSDRAGTNKKKQYCMDIDS